MKFSLKKATAFIVIGVVALSLYDATDKHITNLDKLGITITKNLLTNTYKAKAVIQSKEVVKEIEKKDVVNLMVLNKEAKEFEINAQKKKLENAKEELAEMKILQKLMNNGIELTPEQLEEILPAATRRIRELEAEEQMEESEPLNLNKNKPRMI